MLKSLLRRIKQHRLILASLAFWALVQFLAIPAAETPLIKIIMSVLAIVPVAYFIVFGEKFDHYKSFVAASVYGVPTLVILTAIFFILNPGLADSLGKEDFFVENMTAAAVLLASIVMVVLGGRFVFTKQFLRAAIAAMLAIAFFVIGMEEISWMQRILNIESNEFFLANNMQAEINLHNLNTDLTMPIFFSIIFLVFIILPFYTAPVTSILRKIKISKAALFIPNRWLAIPFFTAILAFALKTNFLLLYHHIILIFSTSVLIYYHGVKMPSHLRDYNYAVSFTFVATAFGVAVTLLTNYERLALRAWFTSEYQEFFVCLCILIYAVDLAFRTFSEPAKGNTLKNKRHLKQRA